MACHLKIIIVGHKMKPTTMASKAVATFRSALKALD
jgi:hypothetical protein